MSRVITITAFKRPQALRRLLESIRENNTKGWFIIIQLEPCEHTQECVTASNDVLEGHDYEICINKKVKGIRRNTHSVVEKAFFEGASLVLYLEEDLIVSPDTLDLCAWYHKHFSGSGEILCLNLIARITGSSACLSSHRYANELVKTKSFNSLGIAITKKQWEDYLKKAWLSHCKDYLTHLGQLASGWDYAVYSLLINKSHLYVIQPVLARANHVGGQGTYCTDDYQDLSFSYVEIASVEKAVYRLVDSNVLGSTERAFFILMEEMNKCLCTLQKTEKARREGLHTNLTKKLFERLVQGLIRLRSSESYQLFVLRVKRSHAYKLLFSKARRS